MTAAFAAALACSAKGISTPPPLVAVQAVVLADVTTVVRTRLDVMADDGHVLALHAKVPARPKAVIVLLHGRTWSGVPDFDLQVPGHERSLMDALARRGWATYALDLRGYGASPRDASGWITPQRAVADLAAAIAHVAALHPDLAPPAVLGWSQGSVIAQLQAQGDPKSMSALVLYGYPVDPDDAGKRARVEPSAAAPPRAANTATAAASDFIAPAVTERATIDAFVEAALAADPIRADWRGFDEMNGLDPARVVTPTLVIHGEHDPLAPMAAQSRLFERLGHSDRAWVVLAGGDHAAHLEKTHEAFVHAVVAFLERPRTATGHPKATRGVSSRYATREQHHH